MKLVFKFTSIFVLFSFFSCQNASKEPVNEVLSENTETFAIEPITNLALAPTIYSVTGLEKDTVFLKNGGTIVFDENSFVDKNGALIDGKVDIEWQEFHSLADIFISGIPMTYDSSGVEYNLVSGGMFTIDASHKGEEVEFAPGKSASINLVSQEDTPCYNFYQIDEKSGEWTYETTREGEVVEETAVATSLVELKETLLDVELSINKFPELADKVIVAWKTQDKITTETKRRLQTRASNPVIEKIDSPHSVGKYKMTFKVKDIEQSLIVEPYFYEEAQKRTKLNDQLLQKELNEIKEYQKNVALGKIVRTIEIQNFGTYNWDIVNKRENSQRVIATFEYPSNVNGKFVTLALISPEENIIVRYDAEYDQKFSFDPGKKNCLVAILPTNELVVVSNAGFDAIRKNKSASYTFKFKRTGIILDNPGDLMEHIEKLI